MPRNPLNPRLPKRNAKTGRRQKRKKKVHPPSHSEKMKALWRDPVYRAKIEAAKAAHPERYRRIGIPDGFTKETVKPLWERAYALADKFIQVMKETGRL